MSALFVLAMMALPTTLLERLDALHLEASPRILVVSVAGQQCTLLVNGEARRTYTISTAEKGTGQVLDSYQTPLGLHRIKEKIGKNAPSGAVFVSRELTGRIWRAPSLPPHAGGQEADIPAAHSARSAPNLITTRILWLEGLETGFNRGRDDQGRVVDSRERYIYFHGTNREDALGRPVSKGCVHMGNADIIELFDEVEEGDLIWIQK